MAQEQEYCRILDHLDSSVVSLDVVKQNIRDVLSMPGTFKFMMANRNTTAGRKWAAIKHTIVPHILKQEGLTHFKIGVTRHPFLRMFGHLPGQSTRLIDTPYRDEGYSTLTTVHVSPDNQAAQWLEAVLIDLYKGVDSRCKNIKAGGDSMKPGFPYFVYVASKFQQLLD